MRKGDKMDVLEEAKELMKKAGCEKAFAVYGLELCDIAEVRNCKKNRRIDRTGKRYKSPSSEYKEGINA